MDEAAPPRIADAWANAWPAELFAAHPGLAALYRRLRMEGRMGLSAADIAAEARGAGVTRVVLSATAFPGSPMDNRAVAAMVAEAPDLFTCPTSAPLRQTVVVEKRRISGSS
jgi:hypothetical protein